MPYSILKDNPRWVLKNPNLELPTFLIPIQTSKYELICETTSDPKILILKRVEDTGVLFEIYWFFWEKNLNNDKTQRVDVFIESFLKFDNAFNFADLFFKEQKEKLQELEGIHGTLDMNSFFEEVNQIISNFNNH